MQLDRLPAEVRLRSGDELPINRETLSSDIARERGRLAGAQWMCLLALLPVAGASAV